MTDDPRKSVVARGYDHLVNDYLTWASRIVDDPRVRMVEAFGARLANGARVLDVGCGAGLPSTRALAARFAVTGVDISEEQIKAARRNVPEASFIRADIGQVEFRSGSFEGIAALYSVPHLPREEHGSLFRRVAQWLVPGGIFLASLGSDDAPDWIGPWLGQPMYFSSYDATTNRRLLAEAGFELLIDEVMETHEPEGTVRFLWVLAGCRP